MSRSFFAEPNPSHAAIILVTPWTSPRRERSARALMDWGDSPPEQPVFFATETSIPFREFQGPCSLAALRIQSPWYAGLLLVNKVAARSVLANRSSFSRIYPRSTRVWRKLRVKLPLIDNAFSSSSLDVAQCASSQSKSPVSSAARTTWYVLYPFTIVSIVEVSSPILMLLMSGF